MVRISPSLSAKYGKGPSGPLVGGQWWVVRRCVGPRRGQNVVRLPDAYNPRLTTDDEQIYLKGLSGLFPAVAKIKSGYWSFFDQKLLKSQVSMS